MNLFDRTTRAMLAIDLGAETGRAVLGWIEDGQLRTDELRRFPNEPVKLPDGLHWNVLSLYKEIGRSIDDAIAARGTTGLELTSVGIDAWGVDYGLIDAGGALIGLPYHYRDVRSLRSFGHLDARMPEQALYEATGVHPSPVNTLFQLLADAEAGRLDRADRLLMIPDLIGYWLTGVKTAEETNASTTQLFDPVRRDWSRPVIEAYGLPNSIFPRIALAGSVRGRITGGAAGDPGEIAVINVASHDTACAFAAADAQPGTMVISSGTWFLVGSERVEPIRTSAALQAGFTNELSYGGRVRFIKNCCGLWLLQEARRHWQRDGIPTTYANLSERAAVAAPLAALFDPEDDRFYPPGPMMDRIADACLERGDPAPASIGEVVRSIIDSLAMSMRRALDDLVRVTGEPISQITIVGGGTKSDLLCQAIADATNRPVLAGPAEATAIGNLLIQSITNGFSSNLADARASIAAHPNQFEPAPERQAWEVAYQRFIGAGADQASG